MNVIRQHEQIKIQRMRLGQMMTQSLVYLVLNLDQIFFSEFDRYVDTLETQWGVATKFGLMTHRNHDLSGAEIRGVCHECQTISNPN